MQEQQARVFTGIELSTAHISQETAESITGNEYGVIAYPKLLDGEEVGWFISVTSLTDMAHEEVDEIPEDLSRLLFYALGRGAEWLMIDRDVEESWELPQYIW